MNLHMNRPFFVEHCTYENEIIDSLKRMGYKNKILSLKKNEIFN